VRQRRPSRASPIPGDAASVVPDVWSSSDEALLAGMAAGDQEAATVFVRRFQRKVFGLALGILGDRSQASDAAQDAFVRSWQHAATYDPRRGSVTTWLLTISRNVAIDRLRMNRARPVDYLDLDSLLLVSSEPRAEDIAEQADDTRRVLAILAQLPLEQRRALVLAAIGGRTAREIGEIDGIPLGTAKTRIRTALLRVRELLDESKGATRG